MRRRIVSLILLLIAVFLLATIEVVRGRPFDGGTLLWLLAALAILVYVATYSAWMLIRRIAGRHRIDDIDIAFWISFLVLPISAWLLQAVVQNLLEWYRG